MTNPLRLAASLLLALGALALPGCGPRVRPASSADPRLRVAMSVAPTTFDPAVVQDLETMQLLQQMYEGLVQWTPDNRIAGALAQKWDVSKDGLTYTFHLRNGVKFQNGQTVTADDAAYSLRRALDPKLASTVAPLYLKDIQGAMEVYRGKATTLKGVKVVDAQTLTITLTSPKAYWLGALAYPTGFVLSKAALRGKLGMPLTEEDAKSGVGTGPFQLASYAKDSKVALKANASYWDGAPKLPGLLFPIVVDTGTRHALLANGDIDIAESTISDLEADRADARLRPQIHLWPRAGVQYLALNPRAYAPFKDIRVRQALACATDKEKLRHVGARDVLPVAHDLLPPGVPGYDAAFRGQPYDVDKARALLAQAGYPQGKGLPPLDIYCSQKDPLSVKSIDLMRQMYGALGLTVRVRPLEWGTLLTQINARTTVPAFFVGWYADYVDPQDFYSLLLRSDSAVNRTSYRNAQYDGLCARADMSQNPAQRASLYRQAARIAADQVPIIPIFYATRIELVSPRVQGVQDCLMGHLPYRRVTVQ